MIVASWLFIALVVPTGGSTQNMPDVSVETVAVADGIYMLIGQGGNIGLSVGDDGVFVIDDQFDRMSEKITAAIAGITAEPVKIVINTHWHGDHTGGNEHFAESGAIIIAHDNVRQRMNSTQVSEFFKRETPPSAAAALPVITFDDSVTFHLNGQTIRAEHVAPAHTDGDSIIWFEPANVVHMGDTFFNGFYPFIDVDSNGSVAGMIAAVDLVLQNVDAGTKIIPGHGPLTDREGLLNYREVLTTVADRMQSLIDAGKSLQDILDAKPTADFDEQWGKGFIRPDQWVELVYKSMSEDNR